MTEIIKSAPVAVVPFNTAAKAILGAYKAADKANTKMRDAVQMSMQQYVDTCRQANGSTESSCKALQKAIMECETVANSIALGSMERKTWVEYAQSAARALYWNLPFEASLKNDKDLALPWSKKAASKAGTRAGTTVTTNESELQKTLQKALKQARTIGCTEFAADLLDLCIERLADFKEATE